MTTIEFLRTPVKVMKARRKARKVWQQAIRQMVASGVLYQVRVLSRIG